MTCTLSRSGLSFSRANDRVYDAWGNVTSGSGGNQGYVAKLGHRKDSESGLTYMRARYYEPESGRFVSEDPAMDGRNWFIYCRNNPIALVDATGKSGTDAVDFYEFLREIFGWEETPRIASVIAKAGAIFTGMQMTFAVGAILVDTFFVGTGALAIGLGSASALTAIAAGLTLSILLVVFVALIAATVYLIYMLIVDDIVPELQSS